ncbi:hypothetical protein OG689_40700 [Kitasatospora sp. NBC_00240]|uniref:hypothetical protein n=1 Tax=Kitasatospora sp. NBC_00240 TaxID=2903567 RepID=UPI00225389EF|nr:hypothetical protein [Kitasatospora sp. NBC_00240]MCX5215493.1 hypothetical protein [Kitasatospora sp. NBC_00240]
MVLSGLVDLGVRFVDHVGHGLSRDPLPIYEEFASLIVVLRAELAAASARIVESEPRNAQMDARLGQNSKNSSTGSVRGPGKRAGSNPGTASRTTRRRGRLHPPTAEATTRLGPAHPAGRGNRSSMGENDFIALLGASTSSSGHHSC